MSGIKIKVLKDELKTTNQRLDSFGNELKIILAEINVISNWISGKFGVELIDKSDFFTKRIHNYEEIEEIAGVISSQYASKSNRNKVSETNTRSSKKLKSVLNKIVNSDCSEELEEYYDDSMLSNTEVCLEYTPDKNPVKRKRGRPRKIENSLLSKRLGRTKKAFDDNFNEGCEEAVSNSDKILKEPRKRGRGRPKKDVRIKETDLDSTIVESEHVQAQCDQCGKILKDASSLRQHKQIHRNLRPHLCVTCGKSFRRKFHLKTHNLIHTGDKKHQCRFCGKLFLLPKDLIAHERCIHTGERPFQCNVCTKNFNIKSHLTMHLRVHSGEKPYKCLVCEKCFSQANSLRVHKKTHLKTKNDCDNTPRIRFDAEVSKVNYGPIEVDGAPHQTTEHCNHVSQNSLASSLNEQVVQQQKSTLHLRNIMSPLTSSDIGEGSHSGIGHLLASNNTFPLSQSLSGIPEGSDMNCRFLTIPSLESSRGAEDHTRSVYNGIFF